MSHTPQSGVTRTKLIRNTFFLIKEKKDSFNKMPTIAPQENIEVQFDFHTNGTACQFKVPLSTGVINT